MSNLFFEAQSCIQQHLTVAVGFHDYAKENAFTLKSVH